MPAGDQSLNLKVFEACDTPAPAFAAALLGDFGAQVTVIESAEGSGLRRLGSQAVQAVWWPIIGRNKRSLVLNDADPDLSQMLGAIVRAADLLITDDSFWGRALREAAEAVEHQALVVRLFSPGADRPDTFAGSTDPRFAGLATGVVALTGHPHGAPIQAEFPLADATSGMMAATTALFELRRARLAGVQPVPIELGLHETLLRMNEWQLQVASVQGHAEPRNGNRFPMNWNLGNIFSTRDERLLTVSAATPSVADRMLNMVGGESLRTDPRFNTPQARRDNMDELDARIAQWMAARDSDVAMREVLENDVVVGPLFDAAELLRDEHIAARGDIVRVADGCGGELPMPAPLPHLSALAGRVRHVGPAVGADTKTVLRELGVTDYNRRRPS
jgi:crotonobetainyl-CoA:carnitine CoA-transferase CaiB-like acyl-CoA transferase